MFARFSRVWETHSGPVLSVGISVLFTFFFLFGGFSGFDEYLSTLVFQIGFVSPTPDPRILLVKKDEISSSLLGENPGEKEFAGLIRFLGNAHQVPLQGGGFRSVVLSEFRVGNFPAGSKGNVESSLLGLDPDTQPPAHSFFRISETLTKFPGFIDPSFEIADISGLIWSPQNSPGSFLDPVRQKLVTISPNAAFAKQLPYSTLRITVKLFPKPNIFFSISFAAQIDLPKEYTVPPANVIALNFPIDGPTEDEGAAELVQAVKQSRSLLALLEPEKPTPLSLPTASSSSAKVPAASAPSDTAQFGFTGFSEQQREFVQRVPLLQTTKGHDRLLPSLSLLSAVLYLDRVGPEAQRGKHLPALRQELDRLLPLFLKNEFPSEIRLLDRVIPTDDQGNMEVHFFGSSRAFSKFPVLLSASFHECLDNETLTRFAREHPERAASFSPELVHKSILGAKNFGGRLCFVGPFERSDFDYFSTPLSLASMYRLQNDPLMGIEIHANAALTILDQKFLFPPTKWQTVIALFLSMFVLGLLLEHIRPIPGAIVTLLMMGGACGAAYHAYHAPGHIFLFGPLLMGFPLTWLGHTLVNYIRQRKKAAEIKGMFSRFVAADVVDYMQTHPELVRPGGTRTDLTIFFSTLVDFSSVSKALSPEDTVVLLNEYLGAMTDVLFKYGGALDKFIGDVVMAFWNFPREQKDHPARACLCALEMQKKLRELQDTWAARGLPRLISRCGINSASVVVGCMGSAKAQMNFTCMGDGINLASRLTGANKAYGTRMMISENTNKLVQEHITTRFIDFLAVKGKKEPVRVYEIISAKGQEPSSWVEVAPLYEAGVKLHLERKWDEAISFFESLLVRLPDDGPSKTYVKRCYEYKENPPPENWDGSYHLTHK